MRCEIMLPNRCQCPNTAIDGMNICLLHKQFRDADTAPVNEQVQGEKSVEKE